MPSRKQTAAPAGAEHGTLYVAIEISAKSWLVNISFQDEDTCFLRSITAVWIGNITPIKPFGLKFGLVVQRKFLTRFVSRFVPKIKRDFIITDYQALCPHRKFVGFNNERSANVGITHLPTISRRRRGM